MEFGARNLLIVLAFFATTACVGTEEAPRARPASANDTEPGVAVVNGIAIPDAVFDEAARRLAEDRREPISESDRARVIDRLIDEELLVQYGLAQGFVRDDRRVRAAIVASVMEREKTWPRLGDGDDPRDFYDQHPELFRENDRVRVRTMWFSNRRGDAPARAAAALGELRTGAAIDDVGARRADDEVAPPPNALMPPDKLADYIGGEAARAAAATPERTWSEPVAVPGGVRIVFVEERVVGELKPFEQVEDQIRFEAQRAANEQSVQRLLSKLRAQAKIERSVGANEAAP